MTDDGAETDLDLGHYERFTNAPLSRDCNFTTGKIYLSVIQKERRGEYLGRTVQVIPHVTDEIKAAVQKLAADDVDVIITEIGGTVGDIEGLPFLEAIRQVRLAELDAEAHGRRTAQCERDAWESDALRQTVRETQLPVRGNLPTQTGDG